jgi:hypothetical protein
LTSALTDPASPDSKIYTAGPRRSDVALVLPDAMVAESTGSITDRASFSSQLNGQLCLILDFDIAQVR